MFCHKCDCIKDDKWYLDFKKSKQGEEDEK